MNPWQRRREAELLRRIQAGDRSAADALVARHYEAVFRWLLQLCRSREHAADLTQDTFVQVVRDLDGFRGESSLKTWIHQVAYHTYLRFQRRAPVTAPLAAESDSDQGTRTEETTLTRQLVYDALAQLPEKHRYVAMLHYLQGFTIAQIARILEVPAGTVKSRLHTARPRLRELLSSEVDSSEQEVCSDVVQPR